MSSTLERSTARALPADGGVPARRAMVRWAWRLFRREWRQQLLIVALVAVAVGATVVGATVATDTPSPANAGFGTAQDLATFQGQGPRLASKVATLEHRFGRVEVIENETISIPGSIGIYDLRAQSPRGRFGQPMLSLVAGRYPAGPGEVAVTSGVAASFALKIGDLWHQGGTVRRVVGIVQNPQSLLDEFALVVPGQVKVPSATTVLFDAPGLRPSSIGPNVETPASVAASNPLNPETIALALETLAMLLIGLVAVGGFTVLAQRRLRSIGMVGALGATDRHIRLVVRANGVVVGAVGAVLGAVLGLLAWLAYRPTAETDAHHLMGAFQLPWIPIVAGMVLAVLATYFAASRPGRAITRVPIVTALSGRPAPPKRVHRSAVPGVVFLLVAFFLMSYSGASSSAKPKTPELVLGLAALIPALILLSPFCLATVARLARRAPIAVRLALRDLSRYRARSGSALAAISLGILIAVIVAVVAAARYGNVLDYAGPNLASNQLIVYTPNNNPNCGGPSCGGLTSAATGAKLQAKAKEIANGLGASKVIVLDQTNAGLSHAGPGRNFSGPLYVATPQLLGAFGIEPSSINPKAEILSMRPGFGGISNMQFSYGNGKGSQVSVSQGQGPPGGPGPNSTGAACGPKGGCLPNPVIQQVNALPSGTSAPNTVITEHAVHQFHLQVSTAGWLIQAPQAPTASQITNAQQAAASLGMYVETKNSSPSPSEIINSATLVGILLALGILAMSVGLIRSETAAELRTLAATGASSSTRRTLTATTAGALGLIGAVLGTLAGYVAVIGYIRGNSLNGGISALGSVPLKSLLIILVGMPVVAAIGGWLLSGREQSAMARQPLE